MTWSECEQNSDGSDGWIPILARVDSFELAVTRRALEEHGVVHGLLSLPQTAQRTVAVYRHDLARKKWPIIFVQCTSMHNYFTIPSV